MATFGNGRHVTLPHHARDMAEGTLRAVLREAEINVEDFLDTRNNTSQP